MAEKAATPAADKLPLWQRLSTGTRILAGLFILAALAIGFGIINPGFIAPTTGVVAASEPPMAHSAALPANRVIVYYFHTTYRCTSCRNIEAYTYEAINGAFADQLKDGRLAWKVVNIEQKGNEHFAKDYQLYTKSVILARETHGTTKEWKNLSRIWELLHDKPAFLKYVRDEVRDYLKVGS